MPKEACIIADTYRPTFADKTILTCQWHTPFLSSLIFSFLFLSFFESFFFSLSLFSFSFLSFPFSLFLFSFFRFPFFLFLFSFLSLFSFFPFFPFFIFPLPLNLPTAANFADKTDEWGGVTPPDTPPYRDAPAHQVILLLMYAFFFWSKPVSKYRMLKAYSLILNRGRSQNFQNLIFLHISVALL